MFVSLSRPIRTVCPRHKEDIKIDRQLLSALNYSFLSQLSSGRLLLADDLTREPLSRLRARYDLRISLVDCDVIVTWPMTISTPDNVNDLVNLLLEARFLPVLYFDKIPPHSLSCRRIIYQNMQLAIIFRTLSVNVPPNFINTISLPTFDDDKLHKSQNFVDTAQWWMIIEWLLIITIIAISRYSDPAICG